MLKGFEWDVAKADSNLKKHDISFEEASTVFDDPLSITIDDPEHSFDENRFVTIGLSNRDNLLVVCHCDRAERIRIITARFPTARERKNYENYEVE